MVNATLFSWLLHCTISMHPEEVLRSHSTFGTPNDVDNYLALKFD